ncbi:hypothetical protein K457DRAFT_208313 [Linnemannia elongata AG-77]|uniref:Secreted protein n=1 Tax=Linnemannia elongata AG-77 TaxID=1314771 RepID=A0A197JEC6_9FUNG|nr:hypothetical protein K457DRAFT_208313 [Linnemannia elongata AG-77]
MAVFLSHFLHFLTFFLLSLCLFLQRCQLCFAPSHSRGAFEISLLANCHNTVVFRNAAVFLTVFY